MFKSHGDTICYALVAQLDRVSDYESEGSGFEPLRAHQKARDSVREFRAFVFQYDGELNPRNFYDDYE